MKLDRPWGLGISFQGLHWGAVPHFKPQMSMLCTLFHLLQCQNEIIGVWGTTISSWVELQLCLLEASCSPRAKASPSPSLGTLQPSSLNKEGLLHWTKQGKPRAVTALVPAPRANPQMVSQSAPGPLSPHLKKGWELEQPQLQRGSVKILLPSVCTVWGLWYQTPVCGTSSSELLSPKVSYLPPWQSPIENHPFQQGTCIYLLSSFSH